MDGSEISKNLSETAFLCRAKTTHPSEVPGAGAPPSATAAVWPLISDLCSLFRCLIVLSSACGHSALNSSTAAFYSVWRNKTCYFGYKTCYIAYFFIRTSFPQNCGRDLEGEKHLPLLCIRVSQPPFSVSRPKKLKIQDPRGWRRVVGLSLGGVL